MYLTFPLAAFTKAILSPQFPKSTNLEWQFVNRQVTGIHFAALLFIAAFYGCLIAAIAS